MKSLLWLASRYTKFFPYTNGTIWTKVAETPHHEIFFCPDGLELEELLNHLVDHPFEQPKQKLILCGWSGFKSYFCSPANAHIAPFTHKIECRKVREHYVNKRVKSWDFNHARRQYTYADWFTKVAPIREAQLELLLV